MKKLKFLTVIIAVFVMSNLMFAVKPLSSNEERIAVKMVDKLSKVILLTDSQKLILLENAQVLSNVYEEANSKSNKNDNSNSKRQAYLQYKMVLDSILTADQKKQFEAKKIEIRQTNKKNKSKK